MPIYEYRCDACGHEMDELQKYSDPALTDCPKCGKPALVKLVSAAGFQLKGTGWYQTDFRTKKPGKKDDATIEGKSEGKPEGKSEAGATGAAAASSEGAESKAAVSAPSAGDKPASAAKTEAA